MDMQCDAAKQGSKQDFHSGVPAKSGNLIVNKGKLHGQRRLIAAC